MNGLWTKFSDLASLQIEKDKIIPGIDVNF